MALLLVNFKKVFSLLISELNLKRILKELRTSSRYQETTVRAEDESNKALTPKIPVHRKTIADVAA